MGKPPKERRSCGSRHTPVSVAPRLFCALVVVGLVAPSALADTRIYCFQKLVERGTAEGGKVQVSGFTIEVKAS